MKNRKWNRVIGCAVVMLAVLAGGEPAAPAWLGGVLYWSGEDDGADAGYVAVQMHSLPGGGSVAKVQSGDPESDLDVGLKMNRGLNDAATLSAPPPVSRPFVRPGYDSSDETSLFGDADPSAGLEVKKSGWGWLADEVSKRKATEQDSLREDFQRSSDSDALSDPLRGTGAEIQSNPYGELYDNW